MGSPTEPGKKYDADKPRWDLLPWLAASKVVDVLTFGAAKYGDDNWKKLENLDSRYLAAALRHISAYAKGEWKDPDSGLPHLAHAVTSLLFVLEHRLGGIEEENGFVRCGYEGCTILTTGFGTERLCNECYWKTV